MPIDFTKYGGKNPTPDDRGERRIRVDFSKYATPTYTDEVNSLAKKYNLPAAALNLTNVMKSPLMQRIEQGKPFEAQSTSNEDDSNWNSIVDNPIVRGADTALKWANKPFESVSVTLANAAGKLNNVLGGTQTIKDFSGNDLTLTRSENRNLLNDLKTIWSQTDSQKTSSKAWKGVEPNLGKIEGTGVDWTDAFDFTAQALSPTKLVKPAFSIAEKYAGTKVGDMIERIAEKPTITEPISDTALAVVPQSRSKPTGGMVDTPDVIAQPSSYNPNDAFADVYGLPTSWRAEEAQRIRDSITKALPEPRNADAVRRSKGTDIPSDGSVIIQDGPRLTADEYANRFGLPDKSPEMKEKFRVYNEAKNDLKNIENDLNAIQSAYKKELDNRVTELNAWVDVRKGDKKSQAIVDKKMRATQSKIRDIDKQLAQLKKDERGMINSFAQDFKDMHDAKFEVVQKITEHAPNGIKISRKDYNIKEIPRYLKNAAHKKSEDKTKFSLDEVAQEMGYNSSDELYDEIGNLDHFTRRLPRRAFENKAIMEMRRQGYVDQIQSTREQLLKQKEQIAKELDGPDWLREFVETNNRYPKKNELQALAEKQLREGYRDAGLDVPSWTKANNYEETVNSFSQVRDVMRQSLDEFEPNIKYADAEAPRSTMETKESRVGRNTQMEDGTYRYSDGNPRQSKETNGPIRTDLLEAAQKLSRARQLEKPILGVGINDSPSSQTVKISGEGFQPKINEGSKVKEPPKETETVNTDSFPRKPISKQGNGKVIDAEFTIIPDAVPNTPEEAVRASRGLFARLFGDQEINFTPFSSKKSDRIVTTEQQIVNNPLKDKVKGIGSTIKQGIRTAYQSQVDMLDPIKKISKEAYDASMDATRANNLANQIIRNKFVDNEGNVIGKSLAEVIGMVRGVGKKLDDYLVLRHAVTRMQRGERVYAEELNMTPEKALEKIKVLESRYPEFVELGKEWDNFNTNTLDSGVREGLITKEARDAMRKENPHYASMNRQFTIGEKLAQPKFGGTGSAFSGQKAPIKEVSPTGSTRKIVSPIRSAIEQVYAWKNAEMRNRVMQSIVKAIQLNPDGMSHIATIVKKPSTSYKSLDRVLREGGSEEFLKELNDDFKSLFAKANPGDENIVRAMVKGEPVYVQINDAEAVKALLGMGYEQSGVVLLALQKLSNATKRSATGVFAPVFAVKSLVADTVQASIQSKNAFKHVAVDLPYALISSIGEALRIPGLKNLAEQYYQAGNGYSGLLRGDRAVDNAVYNLRKDAILSPEGLAKGAFAVVKAPFKALEKVSDISENVNRIAKFRREMVGKERTPETIRNASNAAKEATVNYSRKGSLSREMESVFPYSNAAMQSLYRFTKNFKDHPVRTLAGIGIAVVLPKLYEYAQFRDDPDYQNLPARERYRNVIVRKNDDGTFVKIPVAPEYNAIAQIFFDIMDRTVQDDPQAFKVTWDSVVNAFTPPAVSGFLQGLTQGGGIEQSINGGFNASVLSPAIAVAGNQSFTGAPIVPQRLKDNSPKFQYDERTSIVGKKIGEQLNMSPMKVDYLLRAYGGDPARLLLPLFSPYGGGTARNTVLKNFIVDPVFTNTLSNDFYDAKEKYTQAEKDNKNFGEPLPSWYDKNVANMLGSQSLGSVNKRISLLNDQKRLAQGNNSMTNEQKAAKLRDIQEKLNQIFIDANAKLQKSGYSFPNR
jgi:hypothetical protein